MNPVAKIMIFAGIFLILAGAIWHFLSQSGIPLGKLPGDIHLKGKNFSFYFPIMTSIIISVALSLLFLFFSRK